MTRTGDESQQDRVLEPALEPVLFRVVGVEPHGWSTVLVEDDAGRCYIAVTSSGRLSELPRAEANELVRTRTYRRWHGDQSWSEFERLPLISSAFSQPAAPTDESTGDVAR